MRALPVILVVSALSWASACSSSGGGDSGKTGGVGAGEGSASGSGSGSGSGTGSGTGTGGDEGSGTGGDDDTGDGPTAWDCEELRSISGSVTMDTQAEVDAFCDEGNAVEADLYVDVGSDEDPITELDGMACLCEVGGDFTMTGDSSLTPPPPPQDDSSAAAPPPPADPTAHSEVIPPHVVGDIELTILERVGGDLVLTHHPQLDFVQSLVSLQEVGGDIVLDDIPNLQVIKLFGLERVGGTVSVRNMGKLLIMGLDAATSLGGLSLGEAGDSETMYFMVELGLSKLETVTGDLEVVGARNLGLLRATELASVGGDLHVEGTCVTTPYFPALATVGSVHLVGTCGLSDVEASFSALTTVTAADDDGHAIVLTAQGDLEGEATRAWVDGLDLQSGDAVIDTETGCSEVLADYGEGFCG